MRDNDEAIKKRMDIVKADESLDLDAAEVFFSINVLWNVSG